MVSIYAELLEIARRQVALAQSGEIEAAIALIDAREQLLLDAPPATDANADAVREVMRLDRDLATAIRHRMLAVRDEAVALNHGRTALVGYRPPLGERPSRRLNSVS